MLQLHVAVAEVERLRRGRGLGWRGRQRGVRGSRGRMLLQVNDAQLPALVQAGQPVPGQRLLLGVLAESASVVYRLACQVEERELLRLTSRAECSKAASSRRPALSSAALPVSVARALAAPLEDALSVFGRQQHSLRESLRLCPRRAPRVPRTSAACPSRWAVLTLSEHKYSVFALDNAAAVVDALRELGFDAVLSSLADCMADAGAAGGGGDDEEAAGGCAARQHIVVGVMAEVWRMDPPPVLAPSALLYQLEQLDVDRIVAAKAAGFAGKATAAGGAAVTALLRSHALLDYSYSNLELWRAQGHPCAFLLPTGRSARQRAYDAAARFAPAQELEDEDAGSVVQLGGGFERRHAAVRELRVRLGRDGRSAASLATAAVVLDNVWGDERQRRLRAATVGLNVHGHRQRVAEVTRLLHYGSSGLALLSEDGVDSWLERELPGAVFVETGEPQGVDEFRELTRAAAALLAPGDAAAAAATRRLRARARALARVREQRLLLAQTLAALFPGCALRLAKHLRSELPALHKELVAGM